MYVFIAVIFDLIYPPCEQLEAEAVPSSCTLTDAHQFVDYGVIRPTMYSHSLQLYIAVTASNSAVLWKNLVNAILLFFGKLHMKHFYIA